MTGGTAEARGINRALARVAAANGFALGLGSGRVLLEDPSAIAGFDVRDLAPDIPLLANLGAVQLTRGVGIDDCRRLVEMLRADALVLHLNAVQEALQDDGDADFRGVLAAIEVVCAAEAWRGGGQRGGVGIPPDEVRRLFDVGVAVVDVAEREGRHGARSSATATAAVADRSSMPSIKRLGGAHRRRPCCGPGGGRA